MHPLPRLTLEAPAHWFPTVALDQEEVAFVLKHLPIDSRFYEALVKAMDEAKRRADQLNELADRQVPPASYRRFE